MNVKVATPTFTGPTKEVRLDLAGMQATLHPVTGELTIQLPKLYLNGELIAERVFENLREQGFTNDDLDDAIEAFLNKLNEVQTLRVLKDRLIPD